MSKRYELSDSDYQLIMRCLTAEADFHFHKSLTLKRESDIEYHRSEFQNVMSLKMDLREQHLGQ